MSTHSIQFLKTLLCYWLTLSAAGSNFVSAQTQTDLTADNKTLSRYLDQIAGMTADDAVRIALENNGELAAMRKERDAAAAMVKQARLRANPSLEASGAKQIGMTDSSYMVKGMLPLELGGRRGAPDPRRRARACSS